MNLGATRLRPLREEDLKMLLQWRNSEHIRKYALQQQNITYDEHQQWFATLSKRNDHFFIIEEKHIPVGLIWAKEFDTLGCETGFYLYDERVQNSLLSYRVILILHHYLFETKKLIRIECDILTTNQRAVRFNTSLGFEPIQSFSTHTRYRLTREAYQPIELRLKKLLKVF